MISLILTAWKEPKTVGKAVEMLLSDARKYSLACELLLVCPDRETYEAAVAVAHRYREIPFVYIKDPQRGKPFALNLAFRKAQGAIWVLTDGDVWIEPGALKELVGPFNDPAVGAVTGRPVCRNERSTLWGYWGGMFMDAAHAVRLKTLMRGGFYAVSGYLFAMRRGKVVIPAGVLDDVYLSYYIHETGKKIAYAPEARVLVSQPSSFNDWITQKVRSVAGYQGLDRMFPKSTQMRGLGKDLAHILFPLLYARNLRELWWSLLQYPVRLYIWVSAYIQTLNGRRATEIWKRVETTK